MSAMPRLMLAFIAALALSSCTSPDNSGQASTAKPVQPATQTQPASAAAQTPGASLDQIVPLEPGDNAAQVAGSAARIPDPGRPIDHEEARMAAQAVDGVRSAVWLDSDNLVVMVNGAKYRTMDTIDRVCAGLDPLGDTLAVVVNIEDVTAKTADDAESISRNCQLPEGERAANQPKRQIEALDPELRKAFREQQARGH